MMPYAMAYNGVNLSMFSIQLQKHGFQPNQSSHFQKVILECYGQQLQVLQFFQIFLVQHLLFCTFLLYLSTKLKAFCNFFILFSSLIKGRQKDGFPLGTEDFMRQAIRDFPHQESTVFKQLLTSIAPIEKVTRLCTKYFLYSNCSQRFSLRETLVL